MDLSSYKQRCEGCLIDADWKIFRVYGQVLLPINKLRAFIIISYPNKELMKIENTPHFDFIKSLVRRSADKEALNVYKNYIQNNFPKQVNRVQQTVDLIENLMKNKPSNISIVIRLKAKAAFAQIADGIHRVCFLRAIGKEEVWCWIES